MKFTNCGHYATSGFDKWSHVPKWVWDSVLFYASIGVRYALLPVLVKRESIIRGVKQTFSISKVTAYSLVERANKILDLFESNVRILNIGHVLLSEEWEIDDRFHNRMKVKLDEEKLLQGFANQLGINLSETMQILEEVSSKRGSKKGSYWKFMYPTAVVERKPRYCLSIYVGTERNTETAIKALTAARKISTYEPKRFRCDGHDPFIKAIKIMYPNAEIISKTKEEDISIVNTTETIWSIFNLAVPKKRFRTPKTLAQSLNLARHYYNMLRSQNGLGYKTPLEAIGFSIPPSAKNSWVGLLQFAYQFNRFVEYNKRKWREQFSSMEK
ncbi:MAG: hypothetical protein N3E52_04195 [Candidatus Bathyarchaeota archaeon]|nr:hypothetical protein [Candidatus Bathyarchaeota archaeon]